MLEFIAIIISVLIFSAVYMAIMTIKKEAIRCRELLENINKIHIAMYKKEFNIQNETKQNDELIKSEPISESDSKDSI